MLVFLVFSWVVFICTVVLTIVFKCESLAWVVVGSSLGEFG